MGCSEDAWYQGQWHSTSRLGLSRSHPYLRYSAANDAHSTESMVPTGAPEPADGLVRLGNGAVRGPWLRTTSIRRHGRARLALWAAKLTVTNGRSREKHPFSNSPKRRIALLPFDFCCVYAELDADVAC
ncbi:uncharacterized protein K460DRAFT_16998 [Cucurbitaria berberidis CBS 394.84]|uniref:Uncharacterized protein n=1 Tax=Cucurbitaria berberidis CBS 394.84 TaxID=1168544 RepID=A0A9P4GRI8_9PLEO|nr:uncharacterized protein K460DRAFT_16998 [Cucurbitaria berberidis CBS 394.84]KAF1850502.1 hypothetical protein K460DRAFT_16998 [Cucurbitaria berberidis CBS 394.84]